jgi:nucleotide-binding universal stress UspA family protein
VFTQLLVPLDGSKLAESVLPAVVYLAKALPATVALVHVIEKNAPVEVHGDTHLSSPDEAEKYLRGIAARFFTGETKIDTHVHTAPVDDVAKSIVEHVGEFDSDLIVMCAHGRGGVKSLIFGYIAQQVIASGKTPVLLFQPTFDGEPFPFACRRILVPLDGQPEHEMGLKQAKGLAKTCGAVLSLVLVVPTIGTLPGKWAASRRLLPGSTSQMLDMEMQNGEEYLLSLIKELEQEGFSADAELSRGDPADEIIAAAQNSDSDLIVLGTHAKTPMDAFWAGSVAPKICKRSKMPLLLVPVS